jgi:CspA family cold shock protein
MAMQEESMELHIEGQRIEVSDDLRTMIADRLEKLNARHGDVIHARVSLVKSHHHQHGSDEARIILSMTRRKVLQATKVGKTIEEAINSSFDALQHELSHYRGKRRELDKQRLKTAKLGPRLSGKVVQLVTDQGYGFIDIGADEDIYFARQVVMAGTFESLTEGMSVEVDVMEGAEGYEATRVVPLQTGEVRTS